MGGKELHGGTQGWGRWWRDTSYDMEVMIRDDIILQPSWSMMGPNAIECRNAKYMITGKNMNQQLWCGAPLEQETPETILDLPNLLYNISWMCINETELSILL